MTDVKPNNWSSVVAGRWNPAILTPKGIASEIFNIKDDIPIDVLIPIDAMGPPKVRIDGLIVSADFDRLVIGCEKEDWEALDKSRHHCRMAIDALPKTPLTGAGFNIRYELIDPPESFLDLLEMPLVNKLSDSGLEIIEHQVKKTLKWKNGAINISVIKQNSESYLVLMNFHLGTNKIEDLKQWLSIPIADVKDITKTIMCSVLDICEEEKII